MSEQVLYRKYRPRDFSEVAGQEHVVSAIQNAFRMNRIAHAYLFSGPRGVGKTSMARLIAKSLNCIGAGDRPCNTCALCTQFNEGRAVDITEIDAASNRGIDEIRELRDGVRFTPTQGTHKTYIIDEVHQLTKEAFNALLKTLEEPPAHAVFILATTELEKVPATIISRTQHYAFRKPRATEISKRLITIAAKDGASIAQDAAHLIALASEGSFRDAESILGQVMAVEDKKITREGVEEILGLPRREAAKRMFALIAEKKAPEALQLIQELSDAGSDLPYFGKILLQYFHAALLVKNDASLAPYAAADLLPDEYACIKTHMDHFTREELAHAINTIFDHLQRFRKTPIPQLPLELIAVALADRGHGQERKST